MSENFKESIDTDSIEYPQKPKPRRRRRRPSMFGPVVLIAIGVFFLLVNLGVIEDYSFNWTAVFQLWPLFLILIGINIIVKQAPQPLGGILSALVGFAAIGIFGYVLLFGEDDATLNRFEVINSPLEYQTEQINYAPGDVETAVIKIDFGTTGGDVAALVDSNSLIAGQVSYLGDLVFKTSASDTHAEVLLDEKIEGWTWLNPGDWNFDESSARWELGLNPAVETDLHLDAGAGSVNYDLADLRLSELVVDGGAGSMTIMLPDGVYDAAVDHGAGTLRITLPENGRSSLNIDGGAGGITLLLPASMEARVNVNSDAGSFNPDGRFIQIRGDDDNEGVWETAGYATAGNQIDITIDIGAGSVTIQKP
jgi:energy-coupling factor transporter transmembrane protein EcfT